MFIDTSFISHDTLSFVSICKDFPNDYLSRMDRFHVLNYSPISMYRTNMHVIMYRIKPV